MLDKKYFINKDGAVSNEAINYYNNIVAYAKRHDLRNTLAAVDLAAYLHYGEYRDGGQPYIIHPLEATHYLILLNVKNPILAMNSDKLHNKKLAKEATKSELDILLASMLLHDTLEDCEKKLPEKGAEFETKYNLHPDVFKFVSILTKHKDSPGYTLDGYYEQIGNCWQTSIMKIADRVSNCSTIDAFNKKRMEKYVREIVTYFYPMISKTKNQYPDFSRILTIMKFLIVSISESVASVLNLDGIINDDVNYLKTFFFIKGFAVAKSMSNTLEALPLAESYYKDFKRKSGDAFIIHPLRVCSYLIALKIDSDNICAAALLHEIIKKCNLPYHGAELIADKHLKPCILDYIRVMANSENYPLDLYYKTLSQYPEVMLLKLSNRAHTCTTLINSSDNEIKKYVDECENYIYPLCEYGIKHYPEYSNSIQIMYYQIRSLCNIARSLRLHD